MFVFKNKVDFLELQTETINGQRWYLVPSGKKYPSVTTVLGEKENPHLQNWRNMLGPAKAKKETERAAARGTAVHELAEQFLLNQEINSKEVNNAYLKLFNLLKLQLKKINNIRALEIPLYSDQLKIAGRVDCIAEYDGTLAVIDFKTSNNPKTEDMIENYFLQTTAYALMFFERYGVLVEDIVILIAPERGIVPQVFKRKIHQYIPELTNRINTFHGNRKGDK